jgi:hypothetical protein
LGLHIIFLISLLVFGIFLGVSPFLILTLHHCSVGSLTNCLLCMILTVLHRLLVWPIQQEIDLLKVSVSTVLNKTISLTFPFVVNSSHIPSYS